MKVSFATTCPCAKIARRCGNVTDDSGVFHSRLPFCVQYHLGLGHIVEIFRKLCLVILGLSTWEIINQLPFDWSIVSRKVCLVFMLSLVEQKTKSLTSISMYTVTMHGVAGMQQRDAYWPAFFYFYCKYSVWLAVVGVNIFLNVTSEVNCQRLVRTLSFI